MVRGTCADGERKHTRQECWGSFRGLPGRRGGQEARRGWRRRRATRTKWSPSSPAFSALPSLLSPRQLPLPSAHIQAPPHLLWESLKRGRQAAGEPKPSKKRARGRGASACSPRRADTRDRRGNGSAERQRWPWSSSPTRRISCWGDVNGPKLHQTPPNRANYSLEFWAKSSFRHWSRLGLDRPEAWSRGTPKLTGQVQSQRSKAEIGPPHAACTHETDTNSITCSYPLWWLESIGIITQYKTSSAWFHPGERMIWQRGRIDLKPNILISNNLRVGVYETSGGDVVL